MVLRPIVAVDRRVVIVASLGRRFVVSKALRVLLVPT